MRTGYDLARDMIWYDNSRPSIGRFLRRIPQDKANRDRIGPYREKVLHRYASMWLRTTNELRAPNQPPKVAAVQQVRDPRVVGLVFDDDVPLALEIACEAALQPFLRRKLDEQTLREMDRVLYHFLRDKWLTMELVWDIFNQTWVYNEE